MPKVCRVAEAAKYAWFKGWAHYGIKPTPYAGIEDNMAAAIKANKSIGREVEYAKEYERLRKIDPRLLPREEIETLKGFGNWQEFLGVADKVMPRGEARNILSRQKPSTVSKYNRLRKEYPRLPKFPEKVYDSTWRGWAEFLKGNI